MRKIVIFLLVLLCVLSCIPTGVNAAGAEATTGSCNTLQAQQALGGGKDYDGTAKSVLLYELDTRTLVYAHNPDAVVDPTGLVKLLTTLVVLEQGNLDEVVTVKQSSLNSLASDAKKIGLKAKDQLTVRDLLYCVMVASANDAAVVVAEYVAGSQTAFVAKMNAKAATLGCTNSYFTNVHGLYSVDQHSTARDLAIIMEEALRNETFVELFETVNYQLPSSVSCNRDLTTTNSLMNPASKQYDSRITGGKPSAASSSDRSIICTAQSDNGRYLCVIISAKDKNSDYTLTFAEAKTVLKIGLDGYAVQQVLGMEQPFGMYAVSGGENSVVVSPNRDVFALLPIKLDESLLEFRDVRDESSLSAPLKQGTVVGSLQIFYDSILVGTVSLLARHDVAVKGTVIQTVSVPRQSLILIILKWGGICLVAVLLLSGTLLLILRQVNKARYMKKKNTRGNREEESANGLDGTGKSM